MLEVGGASAQQEKGLAQVMVEAKLIADDHAHYVRQKDIWPVRLRI